MASQIERPALDAHAHIATDVTSAQVRRLGGTIIFAVTRSLSEAAAVPHGTYPTIVWGIGVHPGDSAALDRYDGDRLSRLLPRFSLVGEVGLDRRAGRLDRQREVFVDVLTRVSDAAALLSIHSSGCTPEIVDLIEQHRPRCPILHWFTGDHGDISRAAAAGAWFSVNGAAKRETLAAIPPDRLLTETDFPAARRYGAARPGDTAQIELQLADVWGCDLANVRSRVWQNLSHAVARADVSGLPGSVVEHCD